ncbi:MAG: hypothetical protein AAF998_01715 [Bacteroidota bacterium]
METHNRKFCMLILDDESTLDGTKGWSRVLKLFLMHNRYILPFEFNQLDRSIDRIKGPESIDVEIFGTEYNMSFSEVREELTPVRQGGSFDVKDYDVYFIDVEWGNIEQTESLRQTIKGENGAITFQDWNEMSPSELEEGLIPYNLAGFYLLDCLPKSDHPKVLFSGATSTRQVMKLFSCFKNRIVSSDVVIGILDNPSFQIKVRSRVDRYCRNIQTKVLNRITYVRRQELLARFNEALKKIKNANLLEKYPLTSDSATVYQWVNEHTELTLHDIQGIRAESRWSLHSLFPREINTILTPSASEIDVENAISEVRSALELEWRFLIRNLVDHFAELERISNDRGHDYSSSGILTLQALDFQTENKAVPYYIKLSDVPHFHEATELAQERVMEAASPNTGEGLMRLVSKVRDAIYQRSYTQLSSAGGKQMLETYFHNVFKDFGRFGGIAAFVRDVAADFGIYPFDISYLCGIAKSNKRHTGNNHWKADILITQNSIQFLWEFPGIHEEKMKRTGPGSAYHKLLQAAESPTVLSDFGLGDAARIVCFRYQGKFELQSGKAILSAEHTPNYEVVLKEGPDIGLTEYRITIPKIQTQSNEDQDH